MEPADAAREDGLPVEVARFEPRRSLVASVVEHHGRTHTLAAVAVDGGHVGAAHPVVLEAPVEGSHAHGPHPLRDQLPDRIVDHGARDARLEAEAVRQVGGGVELAPAHVDRALGGLAEGDHPRVQAVDERAQGQEVQGAVRTDVQA